MITLLIFIILTGLKAGGAVDVRVNYNKTQEKKHGSLSIYSQSKISTLDWPLERKFQNVPGKQSWNFKQTMGARNRVGTLYRQAT
jgi:hypothetical protein